MLSSDDKQTETIIHCKIGWLCSMYTNNLPVISMNIDWTDCDLVAKRVQT